MIISKKQFVSFFKNHILAIFLLALFFTASSLLWTTDTAHSRADLGSLSFGWPLSFVEQNFNKLDPPAWFFPHDYGLGSPLENSFIINMEALLSAWIINTILLFLVLLLIYTTFHKIRRFFPFLSVKWILGTSVTLLLCLIIFLITIHYASKPSKVYSVPLDVQLPSDINPERLEVLKDDNNFVIGDLD